MPLFSQVSRKLSGQFVGHVQKIEGDSFQPKISHQTVEHYSQIKTDQSQSQLIIY